MAVAVQGKPWPSGSEAPVVRLPATPSRLQALYQMTAFFRDRHSWQHMIWPMHDLSLVSAPASHGQTSTAMPLPALARHHRHGPLPAVAGRSPPWPRAPQLRGLPAEQAVKPARQTQFLPWSPAGSDPARLPAKQGVPSSIA